jgi:hypothetical protein
MKVIKASRRKENGRTIVNLRFKTKDQLLDPDDPSLLQKKELTQDAEDSIISNVFSGSLKKPLTLEIEVPGFPNPEPATEISQAIRDHFRFVLSEQIKETAIFIRERRITLGFAVINIVILGLYALYAGMNENWMNTPVGIAMGGIIIIMNWATIWDSYEFFIFDSRERRHRKKLLNKIIGAEIRVIPLPAENEGSIAK